MYTFGVWVCVVYMFECLFVWESIFNLTIFNEITAYMHVLWMCEFYRLINLAANVFPLFFLNFYMFFFCFVFLLSFPVSPFSVSFITSVKIIIEITSVRKVLGIIWGLYRAWSWRFKQNSFLQYQDWFHSNVLEHLASMIA